GNARVSAAGGIRVVGGAQATGSASLNPGPVTHVAVFADPLASLAPPTGGTARTAVSLSGNASLMIHPGVYASISGSGNARLTMNPGVYIIKGGGFTVTGNASVSGAGVMIYNAGSNFPAAGGSFGGVTLSGNGNISLTPDTTGDYAGILIFQARDNTRALSLS